MPCFPALILLEVVTIIAPSDSPLEEAPLGRADSQTFAEEIHWYCCEQENCLDGCHLAISGQVTLVDNPGIGVKAEDESNNSLEGQSCSDYLVSDGLYITLLINTLQWLVFGLLTHLVAIDGVDQGDVCGGAYGEVDQRNSKTTNEPVSLLCDTHCGQEAVSHGLFPCIFRVCLRP